MPNGIHESGIDPKKGFRPPNWRPVGVDFPQGKIYVKLAINKPPTTTKKHWTGKLKSKIIKDLFWNSSFFRLQVKFLLLCFFLEVKFVVSILATNIYSVLQGNGTNPSPMIFSFSDVKHNSPPKKTWCHFFFSLGKSFGAYNFGILSKVLGSKTLRGLKWRV